MLSRRAFLKQSGVLGLGAVLSMHRFGGAFVAEGVGRAEPHATAHSNAHEPAGDTRQGLGDLLAIERWENSCDMTDCREVTARYCKALQPLKRLSPQSDSWMTSCFFCREKTCFTEVIRDLFCTGCNVSGGVIDLIAHLEGLTWGGAMARLEEMFQREGLRGRQQVFERHWQIMQAASLFYHDVLCSQPTGKTGREWVRKWNIDERCLRQFQLGYSPHEETKGLISYLKEAGYSKREMEIAGLAESKGPTNEYVDTLAGEGVLIPVRDKQGHVWKMLARDSLSVTRGLPARFGIFMSYGVERMVFPAQSWPEDFHRHEQLLVTTRPFDVVLLHQAGVTNVICPVEKDPHGRGDRKHWRTAWAMAHEILFIVQPWMDTGSVFEQVGSLLVHHDRLRFMILPKALEAVLRERGPEGVTGLIAMAVTPKQLYLN